MAGTVSMHPSLPKTKIQNLGAVPSDRSVTIGGVIVESVEEFDELLEKNQSTWNSRKSTYMDKEMAYRTATHFKAGN